MFYYEELPQLIWILVAWSIIFLVPTFFPKDIKYPNFNKYGTIVVLILSVITIIWLLFNKELFHWNYDIATGEPVDHYSTYGKCMARAVLACIISSVNITSSFFRKKKN